MVADDLAANGIVPTNVSNILDVDHLDPIIVESLILPMEKADEFLRLAGREKISARPAG